MIENIYLYLLSINKEKYEPYGCEITEIANYCIDKYDSTRSEFLHFFNYEWKKKFTYTKYEEGLEDTYKGVHVPENKIRAVRKYIKCAEKIEKKDKPEELYSKLAEVMQLPVETIRELAKLADVKVTTSNSMSDEEEEELWSYIAGNVNIEREFEEKEEAENILNKVDKSVPGTESKAAADCFRCYHNKIWLCLEDSEQQYSLSAKKWQKNGTKRVHCQPRENWPGNMDAMRQASAGR